MQSTTFQNSSYQPIGAEKAGQAITQALTQPKDQLRELIQINNKLDDPKWQESEAAASAIKDIMRRSPGSVARLLVKNPNHTTMVCAMTVDMERDEKRAQLADNAFLVAGIGVGVATAGIGFVPAMVASVGLTMTETAYHGWRRESLVSNENKLRKSLVSGTGDSQTSADIRQADTDAGDANSRMIWTMAAGLTDLAFIRPAGEVGPRVAKSLKAKQEMKAAGQLENLQPELKQTAQQLGTAQPEVKQTISQFKNLQKESAAFNQFSQKLTTLYAPEECKDLVGSLVSMEPQARDKLLQALSTDWQPEKESLIKFWNKNGKRLVAEGKVGTKEANQMKKVVTKQIDYYTHLNPEARQMAAKSVLKKFMKEEDISDDMLKKIVAAHDRHGKRFNELSNKEVSQLSRDLKQAGVTDARARRELIERGITGNPPASPSFFDDVLATTQEQEAKLAQEKARTSDAEDLKYLKNKFVSTKREVKAMKAREENAFNVDQKERYAEHLRKRVKEEHRQKKPSKVDPIQKTEPTVDIDDVIRESERQGVFSSLHDRFDIPEEQSRAVVDWLLNKFEATNENKQLLLQIAEQKPADNVDRAFQQFLYAIVTENPKQKEIGELTEKLKSLSLDDPDFMSVQKKIFDLNEPYAPLSDMQRDKMNFALQRFELKKTEFKEGEQKLVDEINKFLDNKKIHFKKDTLLIRDFKKRLKTIADNRKTLATAKSEELRGQLGKLPKVIYDSDRRKALALVNTNKPVEEIIDKAPQVVQGYTLTEAEKTYLDAWLKQFPKKGMDNNLLKQYYEILKKIREIQDYR